MRILIVEDSQIKLKELIKFLKESFSGINITSKTSYQSGMKEILSNSYDLIILDMTLPTFDVSPLEPGGKILKYAGMEILRKMIRKKISIPCVIVTQFETFGEGSSLKTLEELKEELKLNFSQSYRGTVSYNSNGVIWKKELKKKIELLDLV